MLLDDKIIDHGKTRDIESAYYTSEYNFKKKLPSHKLASESSKKCQVGTGGNTTFEIPALPKELVKQGMDMLRIDEQVE